MTVIENPASMSALRAHIEGLDEAGLLAQQISQQGAIHVITFLLVNGCTEALATELLASLREQLATVTRVAEEKGFTKIFSDAPPNFH